MAAMGWLGGWLLVAVALGAGRGEGGGGDGPAAPPRAATPAVDPWAEACRRHGLDPDSPLEGRVRDAIPAVADVVNHFRRQEVPPRLGRPASDRRRAREEYAAQLVAAPRGPEPAPHPLTDGERAELKAAVAALPPGFRRILMRRMRAFNFVDHMVVGGTVVVANPGEPVPLYDIAISATVLGRTATEWLTAKESGVYLPGTGASAVRVRIEAGDKLDALVYVLLHEAAHLVDGVEHVSDPAPGMESSLAFWRTLIRPEPAVGPQINPFRDAAWGGRGEVLPRYADPRRARVEFYAPDCPTTVDEIPAIYASLAATPFVSLYSARNPQEDFAEYATVAHLTEALGHRYRVVLHVAGVEFLAYEPMRSDLVRARLAVMRPFYDDAAAPPPGSPSAGLQHHAQPGEQQGQDRDGRPGEHREDEQGGERRGPVPAAPGQADGLGDQATDRQAEGEEAAHAERPDQAIGQVPEPVLRRHEGEGGPGDGERIAGAHPGRGADARHARRGRQRRDDAGEGQAERPEVADGGRDQGQSHRDGRDQPHHLAEREPESRRRHRPSSSRPSIQPPPRLRS